LQSLIRKFLQYTNLESDTDSFENIHSTIEKDLIFKGTNLWILSFAIIIASVGLNMNSTAVIIGAMLISPLMGPINGMGYGLATYNFSLFQRAVKNFSFAVIASLTASTMYFALTPISIAQSELLARTSPTIYDVLIALFGGLAGIVAISSKHKGNVIPGVAIATALMPPLCTAGYGLATAQSSFFFGAFYLFTINTVFIALSSVVISKVLKFPIITVVGDKHKKSVNRWISIVILLIIIPSIYFGYNLVEKEKFSQNSQKYINNINIFEGNFLLKSEVVPNKKSISLIYGGASLSKKQKENIKNKAKDFSLQDANIIIEQGFTLDYLDKNSTETAKLKNEINRLNLILAQNNSKFDSIAKQSTFGLQLLKELSTLYPQISQLAYTDANFFDIEVNSPNNYTVILLTVNGKNLKQSDKDKIYQWLLERLKIEYLKILYQ